MFYSQTFLARKGPLGTVWCAAHLQHKLKKSHYISTNVFSTVERIMHPEVPIALRMSGHLLLGIVRIFSKQVDYLYQDCNVALIGLTKTFSSSHVNPFEDAPNVPLDSVSLPEEFELDKVQVDNNPHRAEDDHIRSPEDITLPDQPPSVPGMSKLVPTMDEDIMNDSSVPEDASGSGPTPMEEDSRPLVPEGCTETLGDPSTSNQPRLNDDIAGDRSTRDLPEIEIMRAVPDSHMGNSSIFPHLNDDVVEPDRLLEEQMIRDREANTPILKELGASGGPSRTPEPPLSVASEPAHEDFALHSLHGHEAADLTIRSTPPGDKSPEGGLRHTPLEHGSVELAIQPSPPAEQQRARQQRKRRRQFYDEATVITNRVMKNSLEDTSNLLRAKRLRHCHNLGAWKKQNRLKKESIFFEPMITGLSTDLHGIYNPQFISSKHPLVSSRGAHPAAEVEQPPVSGVNNDMEIEHPCNFKGPVVDNLMSEVLPSPQENRSPDMPTASPSRRDEGTPAAMNMDLTPQSDHLGVTARTEILTTPGLTTASTAFQSSDAETTTTILREGRGGQYTALSDIPESGNSPGHLSFLEQDDTLAGTLVSVRVGEKDVPEFDTLPATTRAVGQYIKRRSTGTPNSHYSSESLSLHSMLESKSRKLCARMFFETLVLKSCGFVDMQQEEPYGDISLKVTSKLKDQSSS